MSMILLVTGILLMELCAMHDKAVLYETARYYAREYQQDNPVVNALVLLRFKSDVNRKMLRMECSRAEFRTTREGTELVCEASEKGRQSSAFREALGICSATAEVEAADPVNAVSMLRFARGILFRN